MSEYSPAVLAHLRAPHGPGRLPASDDVKSAEARAAHGGERVRIDLRVASGRIAAAGFQAFGCPVTIAVASAAVERVLGCEVARALALCADELAHALALRPEQAPLAELPVQAIRAALAYPAPPMAEPPRSPNVTWSESRVSRAEREALLGHRAVTVWFTGLSGSGKSTLANAVEEALIRRRALAYVLDGDNVRHGLNANLGFSAEDRSENIRRVGEVAKLLNAAGAIVLTAFISPYRADRARVREILPAGQLLEVFVDCPLEVCERRDVKGLYARARAGEIADFTGISAPYEPPLAPELVVKTAERPLEACVAEVLAALEARGVTRA